MSAATLAPPAIRIRGIEKSFRDVSVLRGVDLDVAPGTIVALLGSNGAGKTTLVRILATLLRELDRREGRYGLETMCIGGGQGLAAVFERVV